MNKIAIGSAWIGALIGAAEAYHLTLEGTEFTSTVLARDVGLVLGGAVIFWLIGAFFASVMKGR